MKRYVNIENSNNVIVRELSITESNISPNGLEYIESNNYIDPLTLDNTDLDIAYPIYKETKEFYWVVANYQTKQQK